MYFHESTVNFHIYMVFCNCFFVLFETHSFFLKSLSISDFGFQKTFKSKKKYITRFTKIKKNKIKMYAVLEDTSSLTEHHTIRLEIKTCATKSLHQYVREINVCIVLNQKMIKIGQLRKNMFFRENNTFYCHIPFVDLLPHAPDTPLHFQIKLNRPLNCSIQLLDIPKCLQGMIKEYAKCCDVQLSII